MATMCLIYFCYSLESCFIEEDKKVKKITSVEDPPNPFIRCLIESSLENISVQTQCDTPHEFQGNTNTSSTQTKVPQNLQDASESTSTPHPDDEGIILLVTESDLELFRYDTNQEKSENQEEYLEKRTVTLANKWMVTDSVGSSEFAGLIEEDPNIDWLTFISNNINY